MRTIAIAIVSTIALMPEQIGAQTVQQALTNHYAASFRACGFPDGASRLLAAGLAPADQTCGLRHLDNRHLDGSSLTSHRIRPNIDSLHGLPRPSFVFNPPRLSEQHVLWLPVPTGNRHTGLVTCHTLFEAALNSQLNLSWAEIGAVAAARKRVTGRAAGVYGSLQSPIWRRYENRDRRAQHAIRLLLWDFYSRNWQGQTPPVLWAIKQVRGYVFDTWTQINVSGTASLAFSQALDIWLFEQDMSLSARTDLAGRATNFHSDVAIDPRSVDWDPLPTPSRLRDEIGRIRPEIDPEDPGDETALLGREYRLVRVVPGVPDTAFCHESIWSAVWRDPTIRERLVLRPSWNTKRGYCSFAISGKIPDRHFPAPGGFGSFDYDVDIVLERPVNRTKPKISISTKVWLEGDLTSDRCGQG